MPEALLARVAIIAAAPPNATQSTTPEHTGVVSLSENLRGAAGQPLPEVGWVMEQRERWMKSDSPLGFLAASTEISATSGCWSMVDSWRDDKGYGFIKDPTPYGFERESHLGVRSHKLAYLLLNRDRDPGYEIPPRADLDHHCRFTGCCNPYHVEEVTKTENNLRQRTARDLENALVAGQIILGPTGREWLDVPATNSKCEEIEIVVNTRFGPFSVLKVDEDPLMLRGERLDDGLLEKVRPPSVRDGARASRARKHRPIKGEDPMFVVEAQVKRKPTLKKLYRDAMKAA
jgi:hypothetical protein